VRLPTLPRTRKMADEENAETNERSIEAKPTEHNWTESSPRNQKHLDIFWIMKQIPSSLVCFVLFVLLLLNIVSPKTSHKLAASLHPVLNTVLHGGALRDNLMIFIGDSLDRGLVEEQCQKHGVEALTPSSMSSCTKCLRN